MNLIVICSDYPIAKENAESSLLRFQLNSIKKSFEKIILLPTVSLKNKKILAGFEHEIIYNFRSFKIFTILNFIKNSKFLLNDLQKIKFDKTFLNSLSRSISVYFKSIFLFTFIEDYFKNQENKIENTAIYSFWFNDSTLGALFFKTKYPKMKIFSGAHGHDLFAERHVGNRIPFREISINLIDNVLVCSSEGKQYLDKNYPRFKNKFTHVNSGISRKAFKAKSSNDGKFRILTLSRTHPVKRISYLLNILKDLDSFADFEIEYYHIGGGQELHNLKELSKNLKFKKIKIFFLGKIPDLDLEFFFKTSPIDVFLNVSSSEGTCLSLVEAMSYSAPVLVTEVGGNISIGNYCSTGLSLDFDSKELSNYFKKIYYNKEFREKLKSNSFNYWEKNHSSESLSHKIDEIFRFICNLK
tara:strand:- start:403 stop:1641 length:1239 start_codon:yes stop_codon:yes gene_type:complete